MYYRYKGRNKHGKLKTGKIHALSEEDALEILQDRNWTIFDLYPLDSILYKDVTIFSQVKQRELILFLRQMSTLMKAGISLAESTSILLEQTNNRFFKEVLFAIKMDLEAGQPLSRAVEEHPKVFPELLVNMFVAGEVSGNLDEILENMALYYEKQYRLKQKVMAASLYPAVVGSVAFLITMFLFAFILPVFENMFTSMEQELPVYTKVLLQISDVFQQIWWVILLILGLLVVLYGYIDRRTKYSKQLDHFKLRTPIFGSFYHKSLLARMTRTWSVLLKGSTPILQSLKITEEIVKNEVMQDVLSQARDSIEEGESMVKPMERHWSFPPLLTQMVAIGEQSGSLDEMLEKVADFYEDDLDYASERLKAVLEPLMIVILSVVVGGIVMAIVIPMFSFFESF
ncbi:type II secretion system F family protein [Radiobacillus kanasensis]|uniref:type II secretion system F family protein n=1 Tax=Radiobacillus kanasensis TaxID=2844358 RepID=UPI001E361A04|nr:type II secretion system F family protein [Radiobacillus kanasensis]UFT97930.1 type II secretion system F family protein [Radiobacillus kanasensis]